MLTFPAWGTIYKSTQSSPFVAVRSETWVSAITLSVEGLILQELRIANKADQSMEQKWRSNSLAFYVFCGILKLSHVNNYWFSTTY